MTLTESAAREAFAAASPAVAIVEFLISGGVGLELCRSFKQRSGVAVVAVSVVDAQDAAMDAGADAFLQPTEYQTRHHGLMRVPRSAKLSRHPPLSNH